MALLSRFIHTFASDLLHGRNTSDEQIGIAAEFGFSFILWITRHLAWCYLLATGERTVFSHQIKKDISALTFHRMVSSDINNEISATIFTTASLSWSIDLLCQARGANTRSASVRRGFRWTLWRASRRLLWMARELVIASLQA